MKKFAVLFLLGILTVGCAQSVDNFFGVDKEGPSISDHVQSGANAASAAGIPFAGAAGSLLGLVGAAWGAFRGKQVKNEKMKSNANYQAFKKVDDDVKSIADTIKQVKSLEDIGKLADLADKLGGVVKSGTEITHSAYGVYDMVEKDLHRMKKKGEIKSI